jgi:hypothetical protein
VEAVAYVRKDNDRRGDAPPVGNFRAHDMAEIMAIDLCVILIYRSGDYVRSTGP